MIKCRGCLTESLEAIPFVEKTMRNFNLLTNLNVQPLDTMPQHLCKNCYQMVYLFEEFRERCVLANNILFSNITNQVIKKEDPDVKIETDTIKEEKTTVPNFCKDVLTEKNSEAGDDFIYDLILSKADESKANNIVQQEELKNNSYTFAVDRRKIKKKRHKMNSVTFSCEEAENNNSTFAVDQLTIKTVNYKKTKSVTFSCGLCVSTFKDKNLLLDHLDSHKENNHICQICVQKFNDWPQLFSHRLTHLLDKKSCHICSKKFQSPPFLEYHYKKIHCFDEKPTLWCFHCDKKFFTPLQLHRHINDCHSEKSFTCDYCSKVFNNKSLLRLHIIGHIGCKPHKCDKCEYSSSYGTNLSQHKMRKHTTISVCCLMCNKVFADQSKRDAHVCSSPELRICPTCGKSFRSNQLRRHMISHEAVGKYKCERCDAVYRSRSSLRAHRDKHDGVRSHRCEYCPAAFFSGPVLIKHRRTHTGIKPYVCKVCNKAFTGNNNLKVHMRVHGEYLITKKTSSEGVVNNNSYGTT